MFFVTFLTPVLTVFIFNGVIFVLVTKVIFQHSFMSMSAKSKSKRSIKQTKRFILSLFGIMTLFGLTWIFGAFTISGASTAFQYLFAICNSLQGFLIFIFFSVIPKDARQSWVDLLFYLKLHKRPLPKLPTWKFHGKGGMHLRNKKTSSTIDKSNTDTLKRISTQSELITLRRSSEEYSSSTVTVPPRGALDPISENEDSHTETEMKTTSLAISDNILMGEANNEVIFNHAALDSIIEEDHDKEDQASIHTDSVPPQQQVDANTGHGLSMATENVREVNVFQSSIYPSLPEVAIESDGPSVAANEKQSVSDNILMRESVSEVIFNHAALDSITETTEEDHDGEDQATDSVPPQQQADANTGHDLSMATENVQEVNVFQSNIYPSLPEVAIESDGPSVAANEKQSVSDNILMRESVSEVIFNHAALDSITETTEEDHDGEDQATDSVPPQQQADANTGHDLSMATENVQEVNVFQSNIYPSLPEVDIESDGLSAAANEKQSVAGGRAVAPE